MLKYLISKGYVNVNKLLIENFLSLNLTYQELAIVLKLFEMLKNKQTTLSVKDLSKRLGIKEDETAVILNSLLDKGLVTIDLEYNKNGKAKERFNLDELIKHLENFFKTEEKNLMLKEQPEALEKMRLLVEDTFKRQLTPLELEIMLEWNQKQVSESLIQRALAMAVSSKKLNLKYVDACLIALENEGAETDVIDDEQSRLLNDFYRNIK